MRNRKCNTELKGITLKQSILCLKHEWIGEILKDKEFTQDKNFAPKQNERDCPMTDIIIKKYFFYKKMKLFGTLNSLNSIKRKGDKIEREKRRYN